MMGSISRIIALAIVSTCAIYPWLARADDLDTIKQLDQTLWSKNSFLCTTDLPSAESDSGKLACGSNDVCFPTAVERDAHGHLDCKDGDMTMFNGLLCFSGEPSACAAVEDAQNDITGQWYRSPRLRAHPHLHPVNSFSPDMGLGLLLWVEADPSKERLERLSWWLDWVSRNQRCIGKGCERRWPRYCPDDDVDGDPEAQLGCTFSAGDLATFGFALKHWGIRARDDVLQQKFDAAAPNAIALAALGAQLNRPGYSQHLSGVTLLVLHELEPDNKSLMAAANLLATAQPKNPFFAWLAGSKNEQVAHLALEVCPHNDGALPRPEDRQDWSWQREDSAQAWKNSMIWECHFVAAITGEGAVQ